MDSNTLEILQALEDEVFRYGSWRYNPPRLPMEQKQVARTQPNGSGRFEKCLNLFMWAVGNSLWQRLKFLCRNEDLKVHQQYPIKQIL